MISPLFPVSNDIAATALINAEDYDTLYQASVDDPAAFWATQGKRLEWIRPYTQVMDTSFVPGDIHIRWFADGQLNASVNCIDRHMRNDPERTAFIWEGDEPSQDAHISYQQLHDEVCKLANVMMDMGVEKGDRVIIYMPMIPQAAYAMLACARIGAVHSVVFAGFSPNAIADRIEDCDARWVITADEGIRGGNKIGLKDNVDAALAQDRPKTVEKVIVYRYTQADVNWLAERDLDWAELTKGANSHCEPAVMNAEDPLFILYTSGSTGKPKGLVHTTGGYLTYASLTHELVFDYHPGEVYWCAADVGWITGHSYMIYGPLANGATVVLFEGVPTYPDAGRMGQVVDKHKVNILYTAPTAIRALMAKGDTATKGSARDSLRVMGSVGEPINPEAWLWYHQKMGNGQCPIVDTWWQTETGGIMITPLVGVNTLKPGSASRPFLGVQPALVDGEGREIHGPGQGNLVLKASWPGQARTIWGDHQRFEQTYFSAFKGLYFSGDGCRRDQDGDYWITGRVDDVLNVSGHRLGTAEIESALVAHPGVAEAAIVGYPHDIKGQGIYAFVIPTQGTEISEGLTRELRQWVKDELSPIAAPDLLQWTDGLPKTRSGKIMRRILRKIAANDYTSLGDTSTLADPGVVDQLVENRLNK